MLETRRTGGLVKSILAVLLVALPLLGTTTRAQAQETGLVDDTTYVLALNGDIVEWAPAWQFSEDLNYVDTQSESVGFVKGSSIQSILYLPSGIDLEDARDSFLEGFTGDNVELQTLDRGAYSNVSYSLDLAKLDDVLFGMFTVYIDGSDYVRSYASLAPYTNLGDAVDDAAAEITINDESIYDGVQGSGLQDLIDASAGDFTPTDVVQGAGDGAGDGADSGSDGDDAGSGDTGDAGDSGDTEGDAAAAGYVATVRENYEELAPTVDDFKEYMADEDNLTDDDLAAMNDILDAWASAPDAAAELVAPDGYEDLQAAYEGYAENLADAADAYDNLMSAKPGTKKSDRALGDLEDAFDANDTLGADLDDQLTAAEADLDASDSGSSGGTTDDNKGSTDGDDDTGSSDADASEYLTTVSDSYDDLSASVDRFLTLFGSDQGLSDADVQELNTILTSWLNAPAAAADLDVPAGYEDVQSAYEDYTGALADAASAFVTLLGSESGSSAASAAAQDFSDALKAADGYGIDLEDALSAAGA